MKTYSVLRQYIPLLVLILLPTICAAQEIRPLELGTPITDTLADGQTHNYQVTLTAGQFAHVTVEQKGQNVGIVVIAPNGEKLTVIDALSYPEGMEHVFLVAEAISSYRFEISPAKGAVSPDSYTLTMTDLRNATPSDQARFNAQRRITEAKLTNKQGETAYLKRVVPKYEEALKLWLQTDELLQATITLNDLATLFPLTMEGLSGQFSKVLGDRSKTIEYLNRALAVWRASANRHGEAMTLNLLGLIHASRGENQKAVENYLNALQLRRALKDSLGEAVTLQNLGIAYGLLGEVQKSLDYLNQALLLWEAGREPKGHAYLLSNIGDFYTGHDESGKAEQFLYRALAEMRALGDRGGEASTLNDLALIYLFRLELQRALDLFGQALRLFREAEDTNGEAIVLHNTAVVFGIIGDPQKSLETWQKVLPLWQAVGNRPVESRTLARVGETWRMLGNMDKASEYLDQALAIGREINSPTTQYIALRIKGQISMSRREYRQAQELFEESLALCRKTRDQVSEAMALAYLGQVAHALGDTQKARGYYRQAIALKVFLYEAGAYQGLARLHLSGGELVEARKNIELALETIESLRASTASPQMRAEYLAAQGSFYDFHLNVLMQMHRQEPTAGYDLAALESSERARARTLLDLLTETHANIRQGVEAKLLEREADLREKMNAKAAEQTSLAGNKTATTQINSVAKDIAELTAQYQELEAQIRAQSPRYAALTQPQPLKTKQIQQLLDADTMLLEYAIGEEKSWLFAVTPTAITSYPLPARKEIEATTKQVAELLAAPPRSAQTDAAFNRQAQALSQMLLAPVAAQLGKKRLAIVATGALQYIPFAMLPEPVVGDRWSVAGANVRANRPPTTDHRPLLLADHEIINLPSASTLVVLRRELANRSPAPKAVAVLADPVFSADDPRVKKGGITSGATFGASTRAENQEAAASSLLARALRSFDDSTQRASLARLYFSREEAEGIFAALSANDGLKAVDFNANRATATSSDLSQYRIVHFATHGLLNSEHPELSGLVLSLVDHEGKPQDGFLRLHDIYNLKLSADLVVLSACQTALGKEIKGEGLIGLTRGFMYAGAPRMVASLWKVDDAATAELMKRFYRAMLQDKQRPAAALRTAQLEMWRKPQWAHPFYWAAFTLQGEWK